MKIEACTISHNQQRYETCGDYFTDKNGVRQFRISKLGNPDFEMLVLLHEMVESYLCQRRGIPDAKIDAFDKWFEDARAQGFVYDDDEPGCHPNSPYLREHMFAMMLERAMAKELGVSWDEYANAIEAL